VRRTVARGGCGRVGARQVTRQVTGLWRGRWRGARPRIG
jgi:hypothetical protein